MFDWFKYLVFYVTENANKIFVIDVKKIVFKHLWKYRLSFKVQTNSKISVSEQNHFHRPLCHNCKRTDQFKDFYFRTKSFSQTTMSSLQTLTNNNSIQFVRSFLEKIPFKLGYNQSVQSYTKSKLSRLEVRLTLSMSEIVVLYWCHSFSLIL